MNIRLKMSKTILFFVVLLGVIAVFCLVPVKAETADTNDNDTKLVPTRNSSSNNRYNDFISVFSFTPISETECDVRLSDKTATYAIIPEKVELNGKEYTVTVVAANGFSAASNWNGNNKNQLVEYNSSFVPEVKYEYVQSNSEIATLSVAEDDEPGVVYEFDGYYVQRFQEFCTTEEDYKELHIPAYYDGPEGYLPVVGIEQFAFSGNSINKLIIDESDTSINLFSNAFNGYKGDEIIFNRKVETQSEGYNEGVLDEISESVFAEAIVSKIVLPYITYIGNYMFYGCVNLSELQFVDLSSQEQDSIESQENIGKNANSSNIIKLPSTITFIGDYAFADVSNVLELYIPTSVKEVGLNIISGWTNQQTVYVDLVADDPILENWNERWAYGNNGVQEDNPKIIYKLSDTEYSIAYNNDFDFHSNPDKYISSQGLELLPAKKKGYTFEGWYLDENFETKIESIEKGTTGNLNLYANMIANKYQIEYDENKPKSTNNVEGNMLNSTHEYDKDSTLTKNVYTLIGWEFIGWNLEKDGTGESYSDESSVSNLIDEGTIVLFAQWRAKTFDIEYKKNRPAASHLVEGEMTISNATSDKKCNLSPNAYSLVGWEFKGWTLDEDGTGEVYIDNIEIATDEKKVTLYAKWEAKTFDIKYESNQPKDTNYDVTGTMENSSATSDLKCSLSENEYKLVGWTFRGWTLNDDGTGVVHSTSINIATDDSEVTLYAKWEPKQFDIKFNPNKPANASHDVLLNGTLATTITKKVTSDTLINFSGTDFSLVGWDFKGWTLEGETKLINTGNFKYATDDSEVVLNANWEPKQFDIKFNPNKPANASHDVLLNGTLATTITKKVTSDTLINFSGTDFSLVGWKLTGWTLQGETKLIDTTDFKYATDDSEVTLYAKWEPKQFDIEYRSNKPSNANNDVVKNIPESLPKYTSDIQGILLTNAVSLAGWRFVGWTLDESGTGEVYETSIKIATDADKVILYAQWVANEITIRFMQNKPANASHEVFGNLDDIIFNEDSSITLKDTYKLLGWTFVEWTTKADGTGETFKNGNKIDGNSSSLTDAEGTIYLYAKWQANTYIIKYDANLPKAHSEFTYSLEEITITYDVDDFSPEYCTLVSWKMKYWQYKLQVFNTLSDLTDLPEDNGEIKLIAIWEEKELSECINSNGQYEIATATQLENISTRSGYYYKLVGDINVGYWSGLDTFNSYLDLNTHTITYKCDHLSTFKSYGFIIKNFGTIWNGYFKVYIRQDWANPGQPSNGMTYVGGVAAENYGKIGYVHVLSTIGEGNDSVDSSKATVDIDVRSNYQTIGGIAGINYSRIESCRNYASIAGSYNIGGIAGSNQTNAKIYTCTNYGRIWYCSISGNYKSVGGIAGLNHKDAVISNSNNLVEIVFAYRTDNTSVDYVYMAKIVGWCHPTASVSYCYGLSMPINLDDVSGLTSAQLAYIKNNTDNIGKVSETPQS